MTYKNATDGLNIHFETSHAYSVHLNFLHHWEIRNFPIPEVFSFSPSPTDFRIFLYFKLLFYISFSVNS